MFGYNYCNITKKESTHNYIKNQRCANNNNNDSVFFSRSIKTQEIITES